MTILLTGTRRPRISGRFVCCLDVVIATNPSLSLTVLIITYLIAVLLQKLEQIEKLKADQAAGKHLELNQVCF